jgi:hypothetical protein
VSEMRQGRRLGSAGLDGRQYPYDYTHLHRPYDDIDVCCVIADDAHLHAMHHRVLACRVAKKATDRTDDIFMETIGMTRTQLGSKDIIHAIMRRASLRLSEFAAIRAQMRCQRCSPRIIVYT